MSLDNLVSKYSAEEAQSMLEEDSNNDNLDEETIFDDRHLLSSISDISSDEEDLYCPSDPSSSSDEDQESTRNASQQLSRNGETWSPLLSARSVRTNPSNIVHFKPGVNPALCNKAAASPHVCWKLFVDNSMLITIQEHTIREAKNKNPNFELSLKKLEAFIGLQYLRGIYEKHIRLNFCGTKSMDQKCFVTQWQGIAL